MPQITIEEAGCRGCTLCVDVCPVGVFELRTEDGIAEARFPDRCISCLSCGYACPSGCIRTEGVEHLRPFHRLQEHAELVRRFLQQQPLVEALSDDDLNEAWEDVSARLEALAATVTEILGTGYRAVARRSGTLAAAHFPEMYEASGLEAVLDSLRARFEHAFTFDYEIEDQGALLHFRPCGICRVVESAGEEAGEAVLCHLFHEYWAGLASAFVGTRYRYRVPKAGAECTLQLQEI